MVCEIQSYDYYLSFQIWTNVKTVHAMPVQTAPTLLAHFHASVNRALLEMDLYVTVRMLFLSNNSFITRSVNLTLTRYTLQLIIV